MLKLAYYKDISTMNIAQLSTMDVRGGGGSRAAYRLHTGLRKLGVNSQMVVKFKYTTDPTVHGKSVHSRLLRKIHNLPLFVDEIPGWFAHSVLQPYYSTAWFPDNLSKRLLPLHPAIINLHWVNGGFVRLESLARWPWPVVWTLHDMWPFAGAEHYPQDDRYVAGYTTHNRPTGESGFDINRWVWQRKRTAWSHLKQLTLVAPSQWLADCARRSALFSHRPITVIPNGIDTNLFQPKNMLEQRRALHLPLDKKLILFAASSIEDKRKGFDLLLEALATLRQHTLAKDLALVVVGRSGNAMLNNLQLPIYHLGYVESESALATIYSAVDVLVMPSRQDNLPNIILEAMACGTPCVGFHIGGLPDVITHQHTGYLAQPEDSQALAHGIQWTLEHNTRLLQLREQTRERIVQYFSDTLQAQRYNTLYHTILDR